ncbi:hypothetical protein SAY87_020628 [Trapa incisa]|uniref:Uncharacterized protein n=1 Tax=Trapa incisa TaxID=236973 RepID=A0AAN7JQ33_9MYRT|nr:hypothetical protein SAY87_020628 [Trapa incisa]
MENVNMPPDDERSLKEATQLMQVLKEMKEGLDKVKSKVKANDYPTADGMSFLEAKYLLLLSYC